MPKEKTYRIISLLPAATEMVCLLDLKNSLVGRSHDSEFPKEIANVPSLTSSLISNALKSLEIDEKVKAYKHKGQSVFHINDTLLQTLHPNIILTQELCPVCAPSFTQVRSAAKIIEEPYLLISLEPESIEDIFANIKLIAEHTNKQKQAAKVIAKLQNRLSRIETILKKIPNQTPSVLIIEWLDPIMVAGHWAPEMVEKADGKMLFTKKGERSIEITWEQVLKANPAIIIIAPCGFDIKRTKKELHLITKRLNFKALTAVKNKQIYLMDGNAYLTRPGPRIIDGVEILAEILYPKVFPRTYPLNAWKRIYSE